ncbi:ADP-ribosylglycohydrolase [Kribbella antiqua]|uniref:ADP-ribosylglycohydrolase n=1 Tax=Kribbella antiqua TaxID=2512217 RepID=A0A4R2IMS9_9ACTN|nr:ADP-ribosylglycohydrolase family protein [Kribbella antiqua]TCO44015.1 ADP-ribosylglycohydrolase [Kribbella antiqua]
MNTAWAEKVYAGVLGKFIGVYLGRPVEGWPYDDIQQRFGLVDRYVAPELGLPIVVADDDISGTFTFARVVEDAVKVEAADVGRTWLNYVIEDRTILWWGGYGRSTEHTAYLNLRRGIPAPGSGSIAVNGSTLAEQIGAQIFSDAFAMMHPGDPSAAVALTRAAASVSHDGVALECAGFLAAMRAAAFDTRELESLIDLGRKYVDDVRLVSLIDNVVERVDSGSDWREVRDWVDRHYGYALYPGPCHALSNLAMSLAALRLGGDDFTRAVAVASSVGFDTDSNAGTVGCLNGIRLGLAAIPQRLRDPIADRAIVVSADGGETVTDAAREAWRIVASADRLAGRAPAPRRPRFDFEFPGSTHGWTSCPYQPGGISTTTFLDPAETVTNFSTVASPTLYSTQTVHVRLNSEAPADVAPYAVYSTGGGVHVERGEAMAVDGAGEIAWEIPTVGNAVPFRLGLELSGAAVRITAVDWIGAPRCWGQSGVLLSSIWDTKPVALAPWVSSAKNFEADFATTFSVSHPDELGVVTTGTRDWLDYSIRSTLVFSLHEAGGLVVRARGHRRFIAAIFRAAGVELIEQRDADRIVLARRDFAYELDRRYDVALSAVGRRLELEIDGHTVLTATTSQLAGGGAGFLIETGTLSADGVEIRTN